MTINKLKPKSYFYWVEKYPNYIVIKKEGFFWSSKGVYAKVLHELLGYKLTLQGNHLSTGGPNIDNIRKKLDEHNLSYICVIGDNCIYSSPSLNDENIKIINNLGDKNFEIQIKGKTGQQKFKRKWTEAEDKILKHLYNDKYYSIEELSDLFITSKICINSRLKELLLIDDGIDDDPENCFEIEINDKSNGVSNNITFEGILFNELRKTRFKISKEIMKPARYICNDVTLHDMVEKEPTCKEDMINVSGIKETKYEEYGEKFIQTIKYVQSLYDEHGFNKETGIHKNGTLFDKYGFNKDGIHKDTGNLRDLRGFDINHINKETGTKYDKSKHDIKGELNPNEKEKLEKEQNYNYQMAFDSSYNKE